MNIIIRNESETDHLEVEELTRDAFWNLHVPGCDEHYLVHVMRGHPDFLPELAFVAVSKDRIAGNVMFTKSHVVNEENTRLETITFGPFSVRPRDQKQGIGAALLQHALKQARIAGYKAVIIHGYPHNYCKHGFVGSKSLAVSDSEGRYPYSLLVLELERGCFQNHAWRFYPSDVFDLDEAASVEFDSRFPPKTKSVTPSQEAFNISKDAYVL